MRKHIIVSLAMVLVLCLSVVIMIQVRAMEPDPGYMDIQIRHIYHNADGSSGNAENSMHIIPGEDYGPEHFAQANYSSKHYAIQSFTVTQAPAPIRFIVKYYLIGDNGEPEFLDEWTDSALYGDKLSDCVNLTKFKPDQCRDGQIQGDSAALTQDGQSIDVYYYPRKAVTLYAAHYVSDDTMEDEEPAFMLMRKEAITVYVGEVYQYSDFQIAIDGYTYDSRTTGESFTVKESTGTVYLYYRIAPAGNVSPNPWGGAWGLTTANRQGLPDATRVGGSADAPAASNPGQEKVYYIEAGDKLVFDANSQYVITITYTENQPKETPTNKPLQTTDTPDSNPDSKIESATAGSSDSGKMSKSDDKDTVSATTQPAATPAPSAAPMGVIQSGAMPAPTAASTPEADAPEPTPEIEDGMFLAEEKTPLGVNGALAESNINVPVPDDGEALIVPAAVTKANPKMEDPFAMVPLVVMGILLMGVICFKKYSWNGK